MLYSYCLHSPSSHTSSAPCVAIALLAADPLDSLPALTSVSASGVWQIPTADRIIESISTLCNLDKSSHHWLKLWLTIRRNVIVNHGRENRMGLTRVQYM